MTPRSQNEIVNRINEITFNSSLMAEVRAIDFVTRLIDLGALPRGKGPGQYRRINLHRIALDGVFDKLTASSKLDSDYDFFLKLRDGGKRAAHDVSARALRRHRGAQHCRPRGREPRRAGVIHFRRGDQKPPRASIDGL